MYWRIPPSESIDRRKEIRSRKEGDGREEKASEYDLLRSEGTGDGEVSQRDRSPDDGE